MRRGRKRPTAIAQLLALSEAERSRTGPTRQCRSQRRLFVASRAWSTMRSRVAKLFDDLRRLRERRGASVFTIAPHPFYVLGGSIGSRLMREIDCFDAIELCHFHKGPLNPNRWAAAVARRSDKPLLATSDAHRLHAFGRHFTSMPRPGELTCENVFAGLRGGPLRLTSPPASLADLVSAIYFIFLAHPFRRRRQAGPRGSSGSFPRNHGDWPPAQSGLRPGEAHSEQSSDTEARGRAAAGSRSRG